METMNRLIRPPHRFAMEGLMQRYQRICDRLKTGLQHMTRSILVAQVPLAESTNSCTCKRPGNCRIVLTTVMDDDSSTHVEPTFVYCNCIPQWHAHHQRQIDFVRFDLKDKEQRVQQLMTLEEGIRSLLVRHREFLKTEIRQAQYWLRQDYARTNMSRELHNLAILRKDPNAAKIPWDKITDWNYTLLHIDKEDLEADEDSYEYSSSALDTSTFERAQIPGDEEMLLLGFGRASSPSTLRESPSYTIVESPSSMTMIGPSPSTVREPSPSTAREHSLSTFQEGPTARPSSSALPTPGYLPSNDPTSCKIQLGRLVSLEETLSRFEDVKYKAASYTEEWGLEDALRAERFNAVYPQTRQGKCCCTTEHRLYHYHLDALFNPIQQLHIESLLRSEMWKSDIQRDNQTTATSNRQEEVNTLLGTFDGHIDAQVRDLQAVQGSKGRLTGLAEYLRRYDGRKDLRSPEDLNRVSAAGKMELLGHVDAMLERWREDDEGVASLE